MPLTVVVYTYPRWLQIRETKCSTLMHFLLGNMFLKCQNKANTFYTNQYTLFHFSNCKWHESDTLFKQQVHWCCASTHPWICIPAMKQVISCCSCFDMYTIYTAVWHMRKWHNALQTSGMHTCASTIKFAKPALVSDRRAHVFFLLLFLTSAYKMKWKSFYKQLVFKPL